MHPGAWDARWRALTAGLILTITLVAFEALAVITILPLVSRDLDGIGLYGWVNSAFALGTLVGIVIAGDQADRHGPAPPFLTGVILFGAGLVIAGIAPTMLVLVVARAVQGLGGGAIPAVAYVSIGRTYPESVRPRIFALLSTAWVVPGLAGPALSALIGEAVGWRAVFLGLVPLVVVSAALAVPALRRLGPPEEPADAVRLLDALRIAAGTGLLLAGLSARSLVRTPVLVAAGVLVAARALVRILPPTTLRAGAGLPAAVLTRGLLTFAFFGADVYVPLAVTRVRGGSTALAGAAITAATLAWTTGAWVQERRALTWSSRRLVRTGLAVLLTGTAITASGLLDWVPLGVMLGGWGVAGLGMGLAYAPLSLTVLREARKGREGAASAALQISDVLGIGLGAGVGGVAVAAGDAAGWDPGTGVAIAFALAASVGVVALAAARRLPAHVAAAEGVDLAQHAPPPPTGTL